jgi:hypothetical protein
MKDDLTTTSDGSISPSGGAASDAKKVANRTTGERSGEMTDERSGEMTDERSGEMTDEPTRLATTHHTERCAELTRPATTRHIERCADPTRLATTRHTERCAELTRLATIRRIEASSVHSRLLPPEKTLPHDRLNDRRSARSRTGPIIISVARDAARA